MAITCTNYDSWIAYWHEEIHRFCLVLVLDAKIAEEMTFQAYLRLGASPPGMDEASARMALYAAAFAVSEAYHFKKLRRRPAKKKLCALLGMEDMDPFIAYLRMPILCRASAYLLHIASFSPESAGRVLRIRSNRAIRLGIVPNMVTICAACRAICLGKNAHKDLSDRLYVRFSERSVAFETRMLDMRYRFDRIVPYLALFVLLLFAYAVYYSLQAGANLPAGM